MRHIKWFLPVTVVVAFGLFGCGKSGQAPATATPPATSVPAASPSAESVPAEGAPATPAIDVAKLKAAFPDDITISDAIGFIKDTDYARALPLLQSMAKSTRLSSAQKQAVDEAVAALKNATGAN
jgi:hypothetical protein